jgi:hypothetical protein
MVEQEEHLRFAETVVRLDGRTLACIDECLVCRLCLFDLLQESHKLNALVQVWKHLYHQRARNQIASLVLSHYEAFYTHYFAIACIKECSHETIV